MSSNASSSHPAPFVIDPLQCGAQGDGRTLCTAALQQAIDLAAAHGGGRVVVPPGVFLSGALFLKSGIELHLAAGAEIRGVQDPSAYPRLLTRIAGFELPWPSALINICSQKHVSLTGAGIINGQGDFWWDLFWGKDRRGGMRADYERRGLRWAADYDCERPRLIQVYKSEGVRLDGPQLHNPGFWTVHICFSSQVVCANLTIRANLLGIGPSSDGIDVDSSREVLIENCDIDCNDDNLCLKSGRDADGLRVNLPTEKVVIRNCLTRAGHGMITLGSETSGGFRDIEVYGLRALGTRNGIRLKSARIRGGFAERILFRDIVMERVDEAFSFELNWFPAYSYPEIPPELPPSAIKPSWRLITERVIPPERGIPDFHDLTFRNIEVKSAGLAFRAEAYAEKPLRHLRFENVTIQAESAGSILHAADWTMQNVHLLTTDASRVHCTDCARVDLPTTSQSGPAVPRPPAQTQVAKPSFVED